MLKSLTSKIYVRLKNAEGIIHWRGHGIHSPFMYGLVREVVVNNNRPPLPAELTFPSEVLNITKYDMDFIIKMYNYLRWPKIVIAEEGEVVSGNTLYIAPPTAPPDLVENTAEQIKRRGYDNCCIVVLGVDDIKERRRICERMAKKNDSVSADMFRYFVFVYNSELQNKHYKIIHK